MTAILRSASRVLHAFAAKSPLAAKVFFGTRRARHRALLAVSIACFGALAAAADPDRVVLQSGTVTRVSDGDSIEVQLASGRARVRLANIDTPEHDQPYGREASAALKALLPLGATQEDKRACRLGFRFWFRLGFWFRRSILWYGDRQQRQINRRALLGADGHTSRHDQQSGSQERDKHAQWEPPVSSLVTALRYV